MSSLQYVPIRHENEESLMIDEIIEKAEKGQPVDINEIYELMSITNTDDLEKLYSAASRVRDKTFGKNIFTYGFVYFSTYCKNNCTFCYFRNTNGIDRYRKSVEEIVEHCGNLQDAGINLADLTMGEDPLMYANNNEQLLKIVSAVRDEIGINIMVSPGAMQENMFAPLRDAGADWFACYQETYNRPLFESRRINQSFDDRKNQKIWARQNGILAEDGMMIGIGESVMDRAQTIQEMVNLNCEQIRAMTFVPQCGTPMEKDPQRDSTEELKAIAVMRLLKHDAMIPCTLDVEGVAGLKTRINAGASVITSIVPPKKHFAGVAQPEMDIDNGNRSVEHVFEVLEETGHHRAPTSEFRKLVADRKSKLPYKN